MNINKKNLLMIGFVFIFVVSFVFLFLQKRSAVISSSELPIAKNESDNKKDLVEIEKVYQREVKRIFNDYTARDSNGSLDLVGIKQLKNDFLALKVTEKYKDIHLQVVLAMLKTEKFLTNGDSADKDESMKIISEIRTQNPWLN